MKNNFFVLGLILLFVVGVTGCSEQRRILFLEEEVDLCPSDALCDFPTYTNLDVVLNLSEVSGDYVLRLQ